MIDCLLDDSTTTTDCNWPSDYTYNNVTGKYYKAVAVAKKWAHARDACAIEGANLFEFRTMEDYQVLEAMKGK